MPEHLGYVATGYLLTAAALGGYALGLRRRLRRARQRAAAIAARGAGTAR